MWWVSNEWRRVSLCLHLRHVEYRRLHIHADSYDANIHSTTWILRGFLDVAFRYYAHPYARGNRAVDRLFTSTCILANSYNEYEKEDQREDHIFAVLLLRGSTTRFCHLAWPISANEFSYFSCVFFITNRDTRYLDPFSFLTLSLSTLRTMRKIF